MTTEYTVADYDDLGVILLQSLSQDHWLILDPQPNQPIRLTRFEDEAAARTAFAAYSQEQP